MTKSQRAVRLYAPLLALLVLQAFITVIATSNRPQTDDPFALTAGSGGFGTDGDGGGFVDGGTDFGGSGDGGEDFSGGGASGGSGVLSGGSSGGGGSTGGAGGAAAGAGGAAGGAAGAGGAGGGAAAATGDTSHCKNGLQFDILIGSNPRCRAKFVGNNGGVTARQGVTATEIHVVQFSAKPNEQVDAILATQGLAASAEEQQAFYDASLKFLHENYEFYGRKIKFERIVGDCPTTPPDVSKCIAAAQEVVKKKPFIVIWGTSLYASVFDIWVQAGIVAIGGQHFAERFFNDRRPFRYDALMDGTQSAKHIAEYICRKLAGKKASHSGQIIHPSIGARNQVNRKFGISVPEIEANVENAQLVRSLIGKCGVPAVIVTYASNIETATQQTEATVTKYVNEKVTSIVCMCDPIAPAFLTAGLSAKQYYPEFVLPGLGLLDYDLLGRIYDKQVMSHAFGPSHLGAAIPLGQSDAARVWRAAGNDGLPCASCNLTWAYMAMLGSSIHHAGPTLNPESIEKGMLTLPPSGGDRPESTLAKFGPKDYTALSDAREVYWSETTVSPIDGKPGAYIATNGGARYELGEWPTNLTVPVPAN